MRRYNDEVGHKVKDRAIGMSIVECLAVIIILAVVAAILLPIVRSASPVSMRTTVLSGLKQVGLSGLMYANDYDDRFPMLAYAYDRNGCLPAPTGTVVSTVFDAVFPYIKMREVFEDSWHPDAVPWYSKDKPESSILGQFGWRPAGTVWSVGFSPNVRLFEDTALNRPYGNNNPVVNSSKLKRPEITPMFFTSRFVPFGADYGSPLPTASGSPDPYASAYQSPTTRFSQYNLPGEASVNGALIVAFADGHAKAFKDDSLFAGVNAPDWSSGTKRTIEAYHFPYDMTGIPDVVAEQYRRGSNPPCH